MASVYVAGSSGEIESCASWAHRLRDAGHDVERDWPAIASANGGPNPRDAQHELRLDLAEGDLRGVFNASIFWLLVPDAPSCGAWVELGYAWSLRRKIIVSGDWRKSIFTSLADLRFDQHEAAFRHITGQREAAQ